MRYGKIKQKTTKKRGESFTSKLEADTFAKLSKCENVTDILLQDKVLIFPKLNPYPNKYWKLDFSCLYLRSRIYVESKGVFDERFLSNCFMLRQNNFEVWKRLILVTTASNFEKQYKTINRVQRPVVTLDYFSSSLASAVSKLDSEQIIYEQKSLNV